MGDASIQRIIRLVLSTIFLVSLLAGATGFTLILRHQAIRNAEERSRILLAAAAGVRDYTNGRILPALIHTAGFHEETVPSFAAQSVFKTVSAGEASYAYREPALNPTATADRATPFEVELIRRFAADPKLKEITGTISPGDQPLFYLAKPIRISDPACLACHDTPLRAPPAMLAKYGTVNGFGWQLHDAVAIQLLTVPVAEEFHNTVELLAFATIGLIIIFGAAYFALSMALERMLATPLRQLADAADAASRNETGAALPTSGAREIRVLADALRRLRLSLAKALEALRGESGL